MPSYKANYLLLRHGEKPKVSMLMLLNPNEVRVAAEKVRSKALEQKSFQLWPGKEQGHCPKTMIFISLNNFVEVPMLLKVSMVGFSCPSIENSRMSHIVALEPHTQSAQLTLSSRPTVTPRRNCFTVIHKQSVQCAWQTHFLRDKYTCIRKLFVKLICFKYDYKLFLKIN